MIVSRVRLPEGVGERRLDHSRKRAALGAGVAGMAALAALAAPLICGPILMPAPQFMSPARAAEVPRPVGFADVVAKVKPAVISVRVRIDGGRRTRDGARQPETPLERFFRRFGAPDGTPDAPGAPSRGRNVVTGQGSGFFISPDGYAVTNFHVIDKSDNVEVTTDDGRNFPAKVIGADERSDIALLKVDAGNLSFVEFAETLPRIGDWVIAVGNPFGLGGTVTAGIVSARGRDIGSGPYDDYIQIDAAVNRGNSGGPTFDIDGNVIGVNSAIVSPSGGSVGIGFAVPADIVKSVVAQLREKGKVTRGWIGVQIQDVTPNIAEDLGVASARGALVAEPQAGGPAAKAGIEAADVITAIDGKEVGDSRDVAKTISAMPPGATTTVTVVRMGEEKTLRIVLGSLPELREAPAPAPAPATGTAAIPSKQRGTSVPRLGLTVAPHAGDGVLVTNIDPDGPAAEEDVTPGDVILQAGGRKVASAADLRNAAEAAQKAGKRTVLMRVKSGGGIKFVALPVGRG
jgi:serine protease Do